MVQQRTVPPSSITHSQNRRSRVTGAGGCDNCVFPPIRSISVEGFDDEEAEGQAHACHNHSLHWNPASETFAWFYKRHPLFLAPNIPNSEVRYGPVGAQRTIHRTSPQQIVGAQFPLVERLGADLHHV